MMSSVFKMDEATRSAFKDTVERHGLQAYIKNMEKVTVEEMKFIMLYQMMDKNADDTNTRLDAIDSSIQTSNKELVTKSELEELRSEVGVLKEEVQQLKSDFKLSSVITMSLDTAVQYNDRYIEKLEKRVTELTNSNIYISNKQSATNRRVRRLNFRFYHSKRVTEEQAELRDKNQYAQKIWDMGICCAFDKEPGSDCKPFLAVAHALTDITREQKGDFIRPKYRSIGVFSSRSAAATFWANKDKVIQYGKDNGFKCSVGSDWDEEATRFMLKWGNHPRVKRIHLLDGVLYIRFKKDEKKTFKVLNEQASKLNDTLIAVEPVQVSTKPIVKPPQYPDILNVVYGRVFNNVTARPMLKYHQDIDTLEEGDVFEDAVGSGVDEGAEEESDQEDSEVESDIESVVVSEEATNTVQSQPVTTRKSKSKTAATLLLPASQPAVIPPLQQQQLLHQFQQQVFQQIQQQSPSPPPKQKRGSKKDKSRS